MTDPKATMSVFFAINLYPYILYHHFVYVSKCRVTEKHVQDPLYQPVHGIENLCNVMNYIVNNILIFNREQQTYIAYSTHHGEWNVLQVYTLIHDHAGQAPSHEEKTKQLLQLPFQLLVLVFLVILWTSLRASCQRKSSGFTTTIHPFLSEYHLFCWRKPNMTNG